MDPRKVAIALVCAAGDLRTVEPVADRLRAGGHETALLTWTEQTPHRFGETLDRVGEPAMVVVCTGHRLDVSHLRMIEGVFGARRGPTQALVRVQVSQPERQLTAAIQRAVDAFAANDGRLNRSPAGEPVPTRDVVELDKAGNQSVVRLGPEEVLDGDTARIHLTDNPKSAELSRRRRIVRERERERQRTTADTPTPVRAQTPAASAGTELREHDRPMIAMIVGAGLLALLLALSLSGIL